MIKCVGMIFICGYNILKYTRHKNLKEKFEDFKEICKFRFENCICKKNSKCKK